MKKTIFLSIALCTAGMALAQSISDKELQEIRSGFNLEGETKALQNILTADKDIKIKALNRSLQGKIDHYTKYRVKVKGITNQNKSGRCWMFASMNALRPLVRQKYNIEEFDFSHNHLFFWDLFEKSNLFLENAIASAKQSFDDRAVVEYFKAPVSDGGHWSLFFNVAEKYGVVPQDVMPETAHSDNTADMRGLLNERLRGGGYKLREMVAAGKKPQDLRKEKTKIMADVYRMLALCLGEPPTTFTWRYKGKKDSTTIHELKNYTPLQFYKEIVPADYSADNYIMVMHDPTRDFYKVYEVENARNTIEGINWQYLNLPLAELKKAALASIKNNEPMYAACDVGKQNNRDAGILDPAMYDYGSLFGVPFDMDKKARILTRHSLSSHAMLLIGCDTDGDDVPTKWEFENSWGDKSGNKGYLTFTDAWFSEYLFSLVVNRKYLDEKAIGSLKQKPVMLPLWDYMN
jgi:bleomycin hydrolase